MNYRLTQKLKELLEKYPDPRKDNYLEIMQKKVRQIPPFVYGIVVDNKDPDCLGRIRLQMDMLTPGCVSPWYHMSNMWTGNEQGFWALPDLGTQMLISFPNGDFFNGVVLGCIYDQKHLPPETSTEKPTESYLWQTKKHRIEIIDESGKEGIHIETAEGQMRCIIDNESGIQIINELGDINIKCKKLTVETDKNVEINGEKKVTVECEDAMKLKSSKDTKITCDKKVTIEGKNIKMSGSKGVTTEGKQIATKDDKVMGMDTHIMVIPAGMSTATTPLPHPFIGKINDKVSDDVKIKDKGVAVKGSKAKHDDSMHMQLPGTIKFQNNPKKEGEVTGGTGSKVKVNGKEVAVIGSQVTTCNDMGMRNNSTIIAVGASIPMPVIINPANTEEFNREQGAEEKEPAFQNVKWASTSVDEGEEIELSAGVKDIADGNMVTLMVFPEGKGPETGGDIARFPLTVKDGSVSAKWSYKPRYMTDELPPDNNPKFVFSAHCAWCNFEKSSNTLEVKLVRPEIKKVEWQDKDSASVDKVYSTEEYILHIETKEIEDGTGLSVSVFNKTTNEKIDDYGVTVKGDKADCKITLPWIDITDKDGCKLYCEVSANKCKKVKSSEVTYPGPEFSNLQWLNTDDEEIDKIEYGTEVKLTAETKNLAEGDKVYIYLYRNTTENEDSYFRKASAVVQDNKINFSFLVKEDKELLEELGEDSEIKYIFVLVPEHYKMIRSEESKELLLNFVFILNIYNNPVDVNQNDKYILEDIDGGKKYQQEKKVKDDLIADDDKITLKFEELKPGIKYCLRYVLEKGNKGNVVYDDMSFVEMVEE